MPSINLTGANQQVSTGKGRYRGFSIAETTGSATARVRIFDSTSAAGTVLEEVSLTANQSAREYYPDWSFAVVNGIYVQVVSGSVSGSVRFE